MLHKHRIKVTIWCNIVTQNTRVDDFVYISPLFITLYATNSWIISDQIPKKKRLACHQTYKRLHKHQLQVAIWWNNVTQNTHFDDLFYSLSLLLTHYATYFLNIGDEFPHQKTMLVSPNIEKATQTLYPCGKLIEYGHSNYNFSRLLKAYRHSF